MDNGIDLKTPWHGASFTRGFGFPYDFAIFNNDENLVAGFRQEGGMTLQDCERLMKLFRRLPDMYQTLVKARNVLNGLKTMTDEEYHGARGLVDSAYEKLVDDMDKVIDEVNEATSKETINE